MAGGTRHFIPYMGPNTRNEHVAQMLSKLLYRAPGSYVSRIVGRQTLKLTRTASGYTYEVCEGGKLIRQQEWPERKASEEVFLCRT